ncbi:MAG: FtsW/RodA/SpoVE family cell cycle protein [Ruminococcus sp.]|nr:FtsW/RodA/SpoVE family cell cycle protein [Ruminococcus sp.]
MQRSTGSNYLKSQFFAVMIGIVGAILFSIVDYTNMIRFWYVAAIVGVLLAASVFLFGITVAGTDDTAWISLPGGITFQPSELIKICFIITFSKHLSYLSEKNLIQNIKGVIFLFVHALIPVAIIHIQGDDGSALIFLMMFAVMSFTAGVQIRYFVGAICGCLACIPIIWNFVMNDEHRNRIIALFDLDGNALSDYGWQQYQGKVSIASGGVFGTGLGEGTRVQNNIVPEQQNDFIFTVAGEELGFVGCLFLILILILLMVKIITVAQNTNDVAGASICYGLFGMLSTQTLINLGMVLGFLPVIGITLPFFSQGGTSAMSMFFGVGLVQSVYLHNKLDIDDRLSFAYKELLKD